MPFPVELDSNMMIDMLFIYIYYHTIAIRVGFEVPGYTYTEPAFDRIVDQFYVSATGQPENGPIYVIKEDNVTSEQTFLVSVQVTDSAPSGFQAATSGQDYHVPARTRSILFNAFEWRIPFAFTLLADTLPEGDEVFQLSVSPEDTGDIGGGTEQFPTFRNPITLASEVFITIDVTKCEFVVSYMYFISNLLSFHFFSDYDWLC